MKILFIGDVVGPQGCRFLQKKLPQLKAQYRPDLTICNGENSAAGNGLTFDSADWLLRCGADVITTGNHLFKKPEARQVLERCPHVVRPLNYDCAPGDGYYLFDSIKGRVCVVSLMGTVFLDALPCPFRTIDAFLAHPPVEYDCLVLDFHAEATSEKRAMGFFLDGRAAAVLGTHTHVQTADAQLLPGGTAYITDAGMTGPIDSVLGVKKEVILQRFLTHLPNRFEIADGDCSVQGVFFDTDGKKAKTIHAFCES
ncbi:TIGR00282 family metallophosphoesterase [Neobittarella massiliensis]|uniref:TIGR00282 family metallophosphoesterase n=1 Tax=Neobittarella massiliensis (ex Bilen et al. 2018) TaxID=2041842 RepID=A0A8J6IM44_9FIRM|nr:TIGR00282 family metallophosphoesterase [Neobittarella massiliensis]MBC3515032.1 TIGR00282 family metallophosphoesterase [Neobittarella massiliensis]